MQQLTCVEPGTWRLEDVSPPAPQPHEVLLRVRRIGVCGTDLHAFRGRQPFFEYPRVLGHELAAEVVDVGRDVVGVSVGAEVVVDPYLTCGSCRPCRLGRTNCCASLQVAGVHCDGGMRELMTLPATQVFAAEGLSLDQMAIVECLGIGAHAVRRSELDAGDVALVVGAGPIGMGVVQFARLAGARVIVIEPDARRRTYCEERLGADKGLAPDGETLAALQELTGGELAPVVFDATGSAASMERSFDYVASGGTYVLVSLVLGTIGFDDPEFHRRELTLRSSRNATRDDLESVVAEFRAGQLAADSFITHRAPLRSVPDEFAGWLDPASQVTKAMIEI